MAHLERVRRSRRAAAPAGRLRGPRRAVEARCTTSPILTHSLHPHVAPNASCTCGIYAGRSLGDFDRPRPAWPPPSVVGTVALWGTVIEHERGWRARYAYPARLT